MVKHTKKLSLLKPAQIDRKTMLYPLDDESGNMIVVDFNRRSLPITAEDVRIPFYPEKDDMVKILGDDDSLWFAKVIGIEKNRMARVRYYEKNASGKMVPKRKERIDLVSWDAILGLI